MLSFDESINLIKKHLKAWDRVEKVAITQCFGRVLAQDIKAPFNQPAQKMASMDGYAIKFSEQNQPLKVLGSTPAGTLPKFKLRAGECVKTMTGSILCDGSDTLIPVENVQLQDDFIIVKERVSEGFAVRQIGESYKSGELLLKKGARLDFSEIALLVELGIFHISVFVRPIIGILSSGSEIKDLGESLENAAQIRSTNHITLGVLAQKFNCEMRIFPLIKDDEKLLKNAISNALMSCDFLITTGGVSMGDFDFLKAIVREYELILDKVSIKPGRHIKIAKFNEKFILALPGFAYSSAVLFILFMKEILSALNLMQDDYKIKAILSEDYAKKSKFSEFVACNLVFENAKIFANLDGKKQGSSAILNNLNNNSALMRIEKDFTKKGEIVDIYLI